MIQTINLTPGFDPMGLGTSIAFKQFTFPGGETHIQIHSPLSVNDSVIITSRLRSAEDVMLLLIANDALRRAGVTAIRASLPYIPYGRQDRLMNPGEPLSILVMANLINSCRFDAVRIYDPHSDVTPALINNCIVGGGHHHFLGYVLSTENGFTIASSSYYRLVVPDAGAMKRAHAAAKTLGLESWQILQATKHRDVETGNITGTTVEPSHGGDPDNPKSMVKYVVYDDICDGGRTFIEIAKEYQKLGVTPDQMILVVSHGIFSNGLEELRKYYHTIRSTDSFPSEVAIPFNKFSDYRYDKKSPALD